ncbi:MAG TPA: DUF389 domain-containing protein [Thermoanaerobaculia bacterium]|nr:DUF389 domain-containing protein [Thermoanaerobaculia bacterium]
MRQIIVQVPRGRGDEVLERTRPFAVVNASAWEARDRDGEHDVVLLHVSNRRVEGLVAALEAIEELQLTLEPRGVITLRPPADEAHHQVLEVEERSPLEYFLGGLQSVGSWRGFLGYAAAAGVVVWIGLFTDTTYLLTAAMLIAPFAGPAMNVALGSARGDAELLRRGVLRYCAALGVGVAVAFLLSLALSQDVATEQMIARSQISVVAVLLPLVAGAAGALNLVQSERSSLVSGAATGMLVAASLAPPAGLVGMGAALGEWGMVGSASYLLVLQLLGINLAGAAVFRLYGLSAHGPRLERGRSWLFPAALIVSGLGLAALLAFQLGEPPVLRRSSQAQRAVAEVQRMLRESPLVDPVEVDARFTRSGEGGENVLLVVAYARRLPGVEISDEAIRGQLAAALQAALRQSDPPVVPLVSVTVLEPPPHPPP